MKRLRWMFAVGLILIAAGYGVITGIRTTERPKKTATYAERMYQAKKMDGTYVKDRIRFMLIMRVRQPDMAPQYKEHFISIADTIAERMHAMIMSEVVAPVNAPKSQQDSLILSNELMKYVQPVNVTRELYALSDAFDIDNELLRAIYYNALADHEIEVRRYMKLIDIDRIKLRKREPFPDDYDFRIFTLS